MEKGEDGEETRRESGGAGRGVGARSEATGDLTEERGRRAAWREYVFWLRKVKKAWRFFACGMVLGITPRRPTTGLFGVAFGGFMWKKAGQTSQKG